MTSTKNDQTTNESTRQEKTGNINTALDLTDENNGNVSGLGQQQIYHNKQSERNAILLNNIKNDLLTLRKENDGGTDIRTNQQPASHSRSDESETESKKQIKCAEHELEFKDKDSDRSMSISATSTDTASTFKRSLSFGDRPHWRTKQEGLDGPVQAFEYTTDEVKQKTRQEMNTPVIWTTGSSSSGAGVYDDTWRLSLEEFTSRRQGTMKRKSKDIPKRLRSFYKQQDQLIDTFHEVRTVTADNVSYYKSQDQLINQFEVHRLELDDAMENAESMKRLQKKAGTYAKITFFANLLLLVIKIIAVVLSGSISLISSLVDSSVDLLSGIVIWVTTRAVRKTDRYVYPQGRTKLEPMSIVILSVIMSVASLQIIKESFGKIIGLSNSSSLPPVMDGVTIGIASATVVIKLALFILCRRIKYPTMQALAQDHRNDVLSNTLAIIFGYVGSQEMQQQTSVFGLVYLDPVGAITISVYIIVMWCITGWDQIKLLIGHTATPEFLSKITWICVDHHQKIQKVDTVRAFHFGNNFLVEVDIVLPPEMMLSEAHDIAQPLQQKIERLPAVERAFVHIDYETDHNPNTEHKVV